MVKEGSFSRASEQKESSSLERKEKLNDILDKFLEQPGRPENDLMEVAKVFIAEKVSPEEYEGLIGKVEQACLSKINMIERYQIFLRGDCLSSEEKQEALDNKEFLAPSVRNVPRAIIGDTTDRAILGSFLIQLGKRTDTAYRKEYKFYCSSKKQNKEFVEEPILIYGFGAIDKARLKEIKSVLETGEEYFYGDADDSGEAIPNLHYIDLPKTITWGSEADSHSCSNSLREFFPNLPYLYHLEDYGVPEKLLPRMEERILRYADSPSFAQSNTDGLHCLLFLPKPHFHYLLMAYKILSDIEALEKANKE